MTSRSLAERILDRALPDGPSGHAIRGDLRQEHARRVRESGDRAAARWYLRQALSIWFFASRDGVVGRRWRSGRLVSDTRSSGGGVVADVREGVSVLRRAPAYSTGVVLTLGVAMAATVSVFAVVRGVLLRDLPYPEPHELVRFDAARDDGGYANGGLDYPVVLDWREGLETVPSVAAYQGSDGVYVADGVAEVWQGTAAEPSFLEVVGVAPFLGSAYGPGEGGIGDQSIFLSHSLWERRFAGDPGIVGQSITFYEAPWVVRGVLPPDFAYPGTRLDYLIPLRDTQWLEGRGTGVLRVIGRLGDGVSLDAAREELGALSTALEREYPGEIRTVLLRGVQQVETEPVRPMLWVFMGAVGFFLLVACANVSGLALARTEARRQELSVRLSLGASRARLARQVVSESATLALAGGLVGTLGAFWGIRGLLTLAPADLPLREGVRMDPLVLLFAFVLAVGTGVLFGALPGVRSARIAGVRLTATRSESRGAREAKRSLASAQIALAVVLLSGAVLLTRSFAALNSVPTGFTEPGRVLMVEMGLGRADYPTGDEVLSFHRALVEGSSALPGVVAAGLSTHLPFSTSGVQASVVRDGEVYRRGEAPLLGLEVVNGEYRSALGLPLLRGREPAIDPATDDPVREVMINEAGARLLWGDDDPLGQRFSFDLEAGEVPSPESFYTVVGLVPDVSDGALDLDVRPRAYYFMPDFLQQYSWITGRFFYLVLRTEGDPYALVDPLRDVVQRLDPNAPLRTVSSLEEMVRRTTMPARFRTVTLSVFALLAVVVALLGVYGVMAYGVATSVRDIGIRMALGAPASQVRRGVLNQAIRVVAVGGLVGLAGATLLGPVIRSMLFRVSPRDPVTFAGVFLLAVIGALGAAYIPALRASRIDPIEVLRQE